MTIQAETIIQNQVSTGMDADQKLVAEITSIKTGHLIELSFRLALSTSNAEIVLANRIGRELVKRMSEQEYQEHMDCIDSLFNLV